MSGCPELIGHDPQLRGGHRDPIRLLPGRLTLPAPSIAFPRLVPNDFAAVQPAVQHLADCGPCPAGRPALLGPRRWCAFLVQRLRDPDEAVADRAHLENPTDDGGLGL